jgi:hypothetical protein
MNELKKNTGIEIVNREVCVLFPTFKWKKQCFNPLQTVDHDCRHHGLELYSMPIYPLQRVFLHPK